MKRYRLYFNCMAPHANLGKGIRKIVPLDKIDDENLQYFI